MSFSIVIPVYNEELNIDTLFKELNQVMNSVGYIFEIIYVNDSSTDKTKEKIKLIMKKYDLLKLISHKKRQGQGRALATGINAAAFDNIIVLDGDGQNNPYDLIKMLKIYSSGFDMVRGIRRNRVDSKFKKIQSLLGNAMIKKIINHNLEDLGCAIKIFKKREALDIKFNYNFHRYIALLFYKHNYCVKSILVENRVRHKGLSKYGIGRFFYLIRDLFVLKKYLNQYT